MLKLKTRGCGFGDFLGYVRTGAQGTTQSPESLVLRA